MRSTLLAPVLVLGLASTTASAGMFEYAADDGSGNINIGPSFVADMLWGNYFQANPAYNTITTISVAFGSIAAGRPLEILLFNDPDNDGDPRNAVLLSRSSGVTVNAGLNVFVDYAITPTAVTGGFFVAFRMQVDPATSDKPARLDPQSITGRSWLFFADQLDLGNLGASPYILNMDNAPFAGTWMVRATGIPAPGVAALMMVHMFTAPGRRRRRCG